MKTLDPFVGWSRTKPVRSPPRVSAGSEAVSTVRVPLTTWPKSTNSKSPSSVSASIETEEGDFEFVDFGQVVSGTRTVLTASLPADTRGGLLTGFVLDQPTKGSKVFIPQSSGVLSLGRLRAVGPGAATILPAYTDWIGVDGAHPAAGGAATRIRYVITPALTTRFRPRQPSDGK